MIVMIVIVIFIVFMRINGHAGDQNNRKFFVLSQQTELSESNTHIH